MDLINDQNFTLLLVKGIRNFKKWRDGNGICTDIEFFTERKIQRFKILDEISGLLSDVKIAWDAINAPAVEDDSKSASPEIVDNKAVDTVEKVFVNKPANPVNAHANRALKAYSA